jgi:hypothetical protein
MHWEERGMVAENKAPQVDFVVEYHLQGGLTVQAPFAMEDARNTVAQADETGKLAQAAGPLGRAGWAAALGIAQRRMLDESAVIVGDQEGAAWIISGRRAVIAIRVLDTEAVPQPRQVGFQFRVSPD